MPKFWEQEELLNEPVKCNQKWKTKANCIPFQTSVQCLDRVWSWVCDQGGGSERWEWKMLEMILFAFQLPPPALWWFVEIFIIALGLKWTTRTGMERNGPEQHRDYIASGPGCQAHVPFLQSFKSCLTLRPMPATLSLSLVLLCCMVVFNAPLIWKHSLISFQPLPHITVLMTVFAGSSAV